MRFKRSRFSVDVLDASYKCALSTTLAPGDPVPGYPGMIIRETEETTTGISHEYSILAEGSLDESNPTKVINRGKRRTLDIGFDERSVRYLTWRDWLDCTAVASTDIVTTTSPHGYLTGQAIAFARLTGGAGLTAQSSSSLGVIVYVRRIDATTFTCHTSAAGAAANTGLVDITTNMTAGQVIAAEFALGASHADFAYMHLVEVQWEDEGNDWKTATCLYRGLEEGKPYKRIITVNGQAMSSSKAIYWDFTDGGTDLQRRSVNLPQIVVTDTYLTISTLATSSVPLSQGEGGTPPGAPAIRTVVISGTVDEVVYQWPSGWSLMGVAHSDTLNVLLSPSVSTYTYEYRWPVLLN